MKNNNELSGKLAVTLRNNPFKEGTFIAHVPHRAISMNALISEIADTTQGLDKYQIVHAAELLRDKIEKLLSMGYAVSVLDLGTMYLAAKESVRNYNPDTTDIAGFEVRFSVSQKLKAAAAKIVANVAAVSDNSPAIKSVENPIDGNTEGTLKATFSARLSGRNLKVGGEGSGVWFVPLNAGGVAESDESKWIQVDNNFITVNKAKELTFFLPRTLEEGVRYLIIVRTAVCGSMMRSAFTEGASPIAVTVAA